MPLVLSDVLVPDFGMLGDEGVEEFAAFGVVEIDHVNAVLAEPINASREGTAFADHHGSDAELADQAAAVPARSQRGDHDEVAVAALAAGAAEGVRFAVNAGVALLDAAIAAPAQHFTSLGEQRGADGDAPFVESGAGFFNSDGEHAGVVGRSHGFVGEFWMAFRLLACELDHTGCRRMHDDWLTSRRSERPIAILRNVKADQTNDRALDLSN